MEQKIEAQWTLVWNAHREGAVWEFYKGAVDTTLAKFRAGAGQYTQEQVADLTGAENLHAAHAANFAARLDALKSARDFFRYALESTATSLQNLAQHFVRSLTLANGAVVLGTIAFIGNVRSPELQSALVPVVVLCGAGFLLCLIGTSVLMTRTQALMQLIADMVLLRMSEAKIRNVGNQIKQHSRRTRLIVDPFFYVSTFCLIAALWIGVQALRTETTRSIPTALTTDNKVPK